MIFDTESTGQVGLRRVWSGNDRVIGGWQEGECGIKLVLTLLMPLVW